MEKGKSSPGLAILIGHALAKKGKAKHDPMPEADEEESEGYKSDEEAHQHLTEIATDLIDAVHSKDSEAVADLLQEAFECLEMTKHEEGPHLGEEESY